MTAGSPSTRDLETAPGDRRPGKWVLPGFVDIHTHYDVEVLDGPGLPESVRHGVTTVLIGSCSLSTVHVGGEDAGDLFGRVEAIPREHVIAAVDDAKTWNSAAGIRRRPGGPAAGPQHRGLHRPFRHAHGHNGTGPGDPKGDAADLQRAGRDGADARPRHSTPGSSACPRSSCCSTRSTARPADRGRCRRPTPNRANCAGSSSWCAAAAGCCSPDPTSSNPVNLVSQVAQSLPVLRKKLKTSLLSAADVKSNPFAIAMLGPLARLVNRFGADFRWQHLPVPFEVYADGIDLVVFEEFGSGAAALHLRDEVERNALLQDEDYRRRFRKDYDSKFGMRVWHRDFFDAEIVACPDESVVGKSFGQVGVDRGGLHPVDAFLDLVVEHGTKLRWRTTISNHRPEVLKKLARDDGHPDGLLRCRRASAQHGVLQLRAAPAAARPRRRTRRDAVHDRRAGGAPAHRRTGRLVRHRRRPPAASATAPTWWSLDPEHLDDRLDDYAESPVAQYGGLPTDGQPQRRRRQRWC